MNKTVLILSGGLDSTVLAYDLARRWDVRLLSFDYGQRHNRELICAAETGRKLNLRHDIISIGGLGPLLKGSSLTDKTIPVPECHYEDPLQEDTVVPARNAIMLSIAFGIAHAEGYRNVFFGAHQGDSAIYPDCRKSFITSFKTMINHALPDNDYNLSAPYYTMRKNDIVALGSALNVPFLDTWSCYKGDLLHCGKCGACVERWEAFQQEGVIDPVDYEVPHE